MRSLGAEHPNLKNTGEPENLVTARENPSGRSARTLLHPALQGAPLLWALGHGSSPHAGAAEPNPRRTRVKAAQTTADLAG